MSEECPGCGVEFGSRSELINHIEKVHESICQECGARLKTGEELLKHTKKKHRC